MADQTEENKYRYIEALLKTTREWYAYEISITQSMKLLRLKYKHVPDEYFDNLMKENDVSEFLKLMVQVYAKYLTIEDIQGLIAFYNSDLGRKIGNIDMLNQLTNVAVDWIKMLESSLVAQNKVPEPEKAGDSENG